LLDEKSKEELADRMKSKKVRQKPVVPASPTSERKNVNPYEYKGGRPLFRRQFGQDDLGNLEYKRGIEVADRMRSTLRRIKQEERDKYVRDEEVMLMIDKNIIRRGRMREKALQKLDEQQDKIQARLEHEEKLEEVKQKLYK